MARKRIRQERIIDPPASTWTGELDHQHQLKLVHRVWAEVPRSRTRRPEGQMLIQSGRGSAYAVSISRWASTRSSRAGLSASSSMID